MTVAELSYGMLNRGWRPRRRDQLLPYLRAHYIRYDADETLCDACAEVAWDAQRQGRVSQTADGWIAATGPKVTGGQVVKTAFVVS